MNLKFWDNNIRNLLLMALHFFFIQNFVKIYMIHLKDKLNQCDIKPAFQKISVNENDKK